MAVGVDYSLFYLRREREERAAGNEPRPALLRAASTSGQAVLISGATVLIAMAGMFIAGNRIFTGDGDRDDARRPLRRDRLGHGAAGDALEARRPRRPRPHPVRRHAASTPPASRASGASSSTASCAGRCVASSLAGGLLLARGDAGALDAHEAAELHRHAARAADRARPTRPSIAAFPGAPTPAEVVIQRAERPRPRASPRAIQNARAGGASRPARCSSRSSSASAPTTRSPTSRSRSPATATTRRRSPRCTTLRTVVLPADARQGRRASSTPSRARPPARTTSTSR